MFCQHVGILYQKFEKFDFTHKKKEKCIIINCPALGKFNNFEIDFVSVFSIFFVLQNVLNNFEIIVVFRSQKLETKNL